MLLAPPSTVRWPADDERLTALARAKPSGWWADHAHANPCCREGAPGCDLGEALARLHGKEIAQRA